VIGLQRAAGNAVVAGLLRTTAGEMAKQELGHRYTSLFIQDVRQRVLVALYMRDTQQGTISTRTSPRASATPDRESDGTKGTEAKVNNAAGSYWGARQGGKSTYSFSLSEAGKENAYTAITSLFTPQVDRKARTLIYCDNRVGDPQPVRCVHGELPVDQVGAGLRGRVAHRAAVASAPVEALQAGFAHQPGDPLDVHRQPEPEGQLCMDARRSVGAA
jgi:hypothetical protein